jgi:hypothetical protein
MADDLYNLGYVIGRETSLQIADGQIPDLHILQETPRFQLPNATYEVAASEILAEPGIDIPETAELTALHITDLESGNLVTVIEVVSPGNKKNDLHIANYTQQREQLFLKRGVNVVEIDLTRSYKRLTLNSVTEAVPYHVAIFIPGYGLRVVPMALDQAFKRIAVPLRHHIFGVDLRSVYERSYQGLNIAAMLRYRQRYTLEHLPFPSLLTDEEREKALQQIRLWDEAIQKVQKR